MVDQFVRVRERLDGFPTAKVGMFPTPLHRLDNVSDDLGVNVFLKREDFSGVNLFGGNKIRKLQYVLGEGVAQGCDTVVTYGATQSNHAMQTASACSRLGLKAVLMTAALVEPDYSDLRANFLLDHLMGAEVHTVAADGGDVAAMTLELVAAGEEHAAAAEERGAKVYRVPPGANNVLGAMGALECYVELCEQMSELGERIDHVVHPTGTGGSLSGFALGRAVLGMDSTSILSICAAPLGAGYAAAIAGIGTDLGSRLGLDAGVEADGLRLDDGFVGPGYEEPSDAATSAIRYLARREGVMVGPVYSGKGFAGLLGNVASGAIPQGANVVFVHTGGAQALFAEREIVGDLLGDGQ